MKRVAKILGADVELGNVLQHPAAGVIANDYAARRLLAEIDGIPAYRTYASNAYLTYYASDAYADVSGGGTTRAYDLQDWGRKYIPNGGCFYIDLGHLEVCTAEVRSALDFVAAHHASLRLAREACERANEKLMPGERIVVMANNSDRQGQSWGGHLNLLVSRDLWNQLFDHMYPDLFVLAAFQVSSIVYTGQGKVGAENGKPWVDFQITQRGDFFECLAGAQTTYRRPICNTRDEAHVGTGTTTTAELARLHVICQDVTLTHVSNALKAGVTQLVAAMLEAGWCDKEVMLAEPLAALTTWGRDPDLRAVASLVDGRKVTAVEHQQMFALAARSFVERGEAEHVPDAERILALWEDTLAKLACRDFKSLARRLDWVMKRDLLARLIERNPGLDWHSDAIRAADLMFANLDPAKGLYWAVEKSGGTEQIATDGDIRRAMRKPPVDTRAWARTNLLKQLGHSVESVNWDEIRLRPDQPGATPISIRFDDPRGFTRAEMQRLAEYEAISADEPAAEAITNEHQKG